MRVKLAVLLGMVLIMAVTVVTPTLAQPGISGLSGSRRDGGDKGARCRVQRVRTSRHNRRGVGGELRLGERSARPCRRGGP